MVRGVVMHAHMLELCARSTDSRAAVIQNASRVFRVLAGFTFLVALKAAGGGGRAEAVGPHRVGLKPETTWITLTRKADGQSQNSSLNREES